MPAQQKSDETEGSGVLVAPWWIDYFTFEMWTNTFYFLAEQDKVLQQQSDATQGS